MRFDGICHSKKKEFSKQIEQRNITGTNVGAYVHNNHTICSTNLYDSKLHIVFGNMYSSHKSIKSSIGVYLVSSIILYLSCHQEHYYMVIDHL